MSGDTTNRKLSIETIATKTTKITLKMKEKKAHSEMDECV